MVYLGNKHGHRHKQAQCLPPPVHPLLTHITRIDSEYVIHRQYVSGSFSLTLSLLPPFSIILFLSYFHSLSHVHNHGLFKSDSILLTFSLPCCASLPLSLSLPSSLPPSLLLSLALPLSLFPSPSFTVHPSFSPSLSLFHVVCPSPSLPLSPSADDMRRNGDRSGEEINYGEQGSQKKQFA